MIGGFHRASLLFFAVAAFLLSRSAMSLAAMAGQECPTQSTAERGFVVERNHQPVEVMFPGDRLVRTVFRTSGGETLLETTAFEGLFELERIDRGHRTVFRPTTKLDQFLPLKVGRTITAKFESGDAPQITKSTVTFRVKGREAFFIESCKYGVFSMDKSVGRGDAASVFVETDYYAPDLKVVIAKEFKEPNGTSLINKFDKIYPIKP